MHTMHACMCARLNWQFSGSFHPTLYPHHRIVYRMLEVNNAAKDPSLSVYFCRVCHGLHSPYYRRRQLLVVFSVLRQRCYKWL